MNLWEISLFGDPSVSGSHKILFPTGAVNQHLINMTTNAVPPPHTGPWPD